MRFKLRISKVQNYRQNSKDEWFVTPTNALPVILKY